MTWNIASAKQQFSEVVRLTAEEPQAIYNRDKPVAVLISAQDYEDFQRWRAERDRPTLAQQFDALRALLDELFQQTPPADLAPLLEDAIRATLASDARLLELARAEMDKLGDFLKSFGQGRRARHAYQSF